jgi:hypothetical protein
LENKIGKYLMNIFKAIAVTGMLVLAAEMGFGQVPAAVEVPRDSKLSLHVYGKGVQV